MIFQFGEYTLDLAQGCLRTANREVDLRPKSFEVLRCLVENVGRLVTKDELIKAVWPNVVVTDESLARCISEVRQAIADSDQTIIKTVPRRGYRFSSPVSQHPENADTANVVAAPPAGTKASIEPRISDQASIAVLPFANLSGDPQQEYFSDGITEDIITELSRFSELAVKTFQYKGKTLDVREVERQLGVRYVLEGSIRRAGDRIRINAKLIDAASGAHRWAERYDREVSDVFAVQDEVNRAIVTVLSGYLNMAEAERTLLKPPATWRHMTITCRLHGHTGWGTPNARSPQFTKRGVFLKSPCRSIRTMREPTQSSRGLTQLHTLNRAMVTICLQPAWNAPTGSPEKPCNSMAVCPKRTPSLDGCCCFNGGMTRRS
jgi:TolB-like protein